MMATKIDFIDQVRIASADGTSLTTLKIIVGCNGKVFYGGFGSWTASESGVYDDTSTEIMTVGASQDWYLVDGTVIKSIDGATGGVTTVTSGGAGEPPAGPRIVTLYRNRLIFARTSTDPQNWFMSAVGDYIDFDFTDQDKGVNAAVDGNNSDTDEIGDVLTCLIPYSDDYLVMGCSDSVWMLRGDPLSGGRIDNLIKGGGGIVGQFAWARDSEGALYYMSHTDLMTISAMPSVPVSISKGRLQKFIDAIDFSTVTVRMAWDAKRKGLWLFLCPPTQVGAVHLFWDQRMDAFLPLEFPNNYGPSAVCDLMGVEYADQQVMLGCLDGFIRTTDKAWRTDDGTAIDAWCDFPPVALGAPGQRGIITETTLIMGNVSAPNATIEIYTGDDAQAAITSETPATSFVTAATGRVRRRDRSRGNTAFLRISNSTINTSFSFDDGYMVVENGGGVK